MSRRIDSSAFGLLEDGSEATAFRLSLDNGVSATVTDFGASLIGFCVPDRHGAFDDVVLASADAASLERSPAYFGAAIGRVAGRIGNAQFKLDGNEYQLTPNTPPHHLHGGARGLGRRLWSVEAVDGTAPEIRFSIKSEDKDEGYPGELTASLSYTLEAPAKLTLTFVAQATMPTPFNPTCHAYFNLDGHTAGGVGDHLLRINALLHTPVDDALIPTGKIENVAGTPFDFTEEVPITRTAFQQQGKYDHNFVLPFSSEKMQEAAILRSLRSGRTLRIWTDRPCIHLYTGSAIDEKHGKEGTCYGPLAGLALETQGFPDAMNHESFTEEILSPGQTFVSKTIFDLDE